MQQREQEWAQLSEKIVAEAPALAHTLKVSAEAGATAAAAAVAASGGGGGGKAAEKAGEKGAAAEKAEKDTSGAHHPDFKALMSRVQKLFPPKVISLPLPLPLTLTLYPPPSG